MAKLDRLKEVIYLGEVAIEVIEQPHKKTKEFVSMVKDLGVQGFKQMTNDAGAVDFVADIVSNKPFEALKIFVPDLTQEQFDEGTNRELKEAFKTVLKVNGVDLDALGKNIKPLLTQTLKAVAEKAEQIQN